jgi:hypothetical protein
MPVASEASKKQNGKGGSQQKNVDSQMSKKQNNKDGNNSTRDSWGQKINKWARKEEAVIESYLPEFIENWLNDFGISGQPILFFLFVGLGFYVLYRLAM